MPQRNDIPHILRDEVARAKIAYEIALTEWKAVSIDVPPGTPNPDGALKVRQAATSYRISMDSYDFALKEFNTFIREGIVPDRLKDDQG